MDPAQPGTTSGSALPALATGGLIACYQIGYALAAFTVSPLMVAGLVFGLIFGIVASTTAVMAVMIDPITSNHPHTDAPRASRTLSAPAR